MCVYGFNMMASFGLTLPDWAWPCRTVILIVRDPRGSIRTKWTRWQSDRCGGAHNRSIKCDITRQAQHQLSFMLSICKLTTICFPSSIHSQMFCVGTYRSLHFKRHLCIIHICTKVTWAGLAQLLVRNNSYKPWPLPFNLNAGKMPWNPMTWTTNEMWNSLQIALILHSSQ